MPNESRKWLYEQLTKRGYNVGKDQAEFDSLMCNNDDSRKWAFETARKSGLNVGKDYDEFSSLVGPSAWDVAPDTIVPQQSAAQVQAASAQTPAQAPTQKQSSQPAQAASQTQAQTAQQAQEAPQQSWRPTEQEKMQSAFKIGNIISSFNKQSRERIERARRMTEPATAAGRQKRAVERFGAEVAGVPTKVTGIAPGVSAETPEAGAEDAQGQGVQNGLSPVPYGVRFVDGKAVTQWLLPDGSLTTDITEADKAEWGARRSRLSHEFELRMKENGLDAKNPEDVSKQAQLDAEAPIRKVLEDVWAQAEADDKAADEEYLRQMKEEAKSIGSGLSSVAASAHGVPMASPEGTLRDYERHVKRKDTFNLEDMAQTILERLPESYRSQQMAAYTEYFKEHPEELKGMTLKEASAKALQGMVYNAVYERAVKARMPKSKTDFFMRKLADQPFISQDWWWGKVAAGETGSWGINLADQVAMSEYGANHRALDITGTIASMAIDPTTYISGAVGSAAAKQALKFGGKQMLKGAAKDVAERYAARSLGGRILAGSVGGAGNFATFEGLKNAQGQIAVGGYINPETGEREGFSVGEVLKASGHGLILGGVTGTLSPIIGNIADKYVKATANTAGKVGIRAGEVAVSTLAEGTVFSVPEWISGEGDAMDVWTDNMAMMLGFKLQHGVKSAPRVIASLRPIKPTNGRVLTQAERNHNRMSFEERLRNNLESSPRDLSFTADEREELRRAGYGELADLFIRDREQEARTSDISPEEGAVELRAERVEAERVRRNPEFDGYSAMEELMQDSRVSQAARAKAYYILTGRTLPMGTVTGYTTTTTEDGRVIVSSTTADGEIVTSRTFRNEQESKREVDRVMRQAELNTVDVGERYNEAVADEMVFDAAISEVAPGADLATIKKIYRAVKAGNKDVTESQVQLAEFLDDAIERNKDVADKYRPEAIRHELKEETGIDVDTALRKMPGKRTEAEDAAVKSYLERLFPEESRHKSAEPTPEQNEAQMRYADGRELYERYEAGDVNAQAEVDAVTLRMHEAYQAVEDVFGAESEYYMWHVNENPWTLVDDPELTADQQDAVLYYINAKAALEGVMDASNEAADRKRAEVKQSISKRTHRDKNGKPDGMIISAETKMGQRVYIVMGNVVMFADGKGVDMENSSSQIWVLNPESGEYEPSAPEFIERVFDPLNAQDELDAALSVIDGEQEALFGGAATEEVAEAATPEQTTAEGETVAEAPVPEQTEADKPKAEETDDIFIPFDPELRPNENGVINIPAPEAQHEALTPLQRIPFDEAGEPVFEAVDRDTAWEGLVEAVGNEADAAEIAAAQIAQANAELEALKKKQPKLKSPKLIGSPMAMAQAKREATEKYELELAAYNQQIADAQARADAWTGIAGVYEQRNAEARRQEEEARRILDAAAHEEAVARFEQQQREQAEKRAEQERRGAHSVGTKIKEKWDAATKIEGLTDAITLPDGSTMRGRYVLTEAGAASASHDAGNGYMPTEGFPVDQNGESVNDRDYLHDKDAQRIVEQIAGAYDNRALQTAVIVSKDGVVLSGNNRTMSGDLAARQGTDRAYVDYLREFGQKYGFTPEQVDGMSHPRLVFVPEDDMPYDATTFARFNAQEMKSQSKPEAAVKLGKIVPDEVFGNVTNDISRYDRLSDYYADEKAVAQALGALLQCGVINDKQMPEMRTGTALSAAGKELIENVLIGKAFQSVPDAVRQIISMPSLRQAIVMGLNEIAANRSLAAGGYDISEELAKAVDLYTRAKTAMPDVYSEGMPVSPFGRMQGLFDDEFGDSRVTDGTVLLLADILNSGKPSDLRKVLGIYNNEAAEAASGQIDIFSGDIPTKEEILTKVNEHFRNAIPKEQQALVESAIAERKRRAEAGETSGQRGGGQASEQAADDAERGAGSEQAVGTPRGAGRVGERADNISKREITASLSEETDEYGNHFVKSSNGSTDFGVIDAESGLAEAPIKLSLGENHKDENGKNHGYGLLHIEAGHGDQIRNAGFSSVEEFVESVAKNYSTIREGGIIAGNQTYLLEVSDEHNNTLFIQLSKDGKYGSSRIPGAWISGKVLNLHHENRRCNMDVPSRRGRRPV